MGTQHSTRRLWLAPAVGLAVAAALTACSSSPSSSSSTPSASATTSSASASPSMTTPAATTAPATPSASASTAKKMTAAESIAAIKKNWVIFFNGKTPVATRQSLLENGSAFTALLKSQAKDPQAAMAGSSVQSVTLTSATKANVVYSILLSGTPVLTKQKGAAVYEGGTWKVATSSFCSLVLLESGGKAVGGCK